MKKRLFIFSFLFAIMCINLTGCTIKLDEENIQVFDKVKNLVDAEVENEDNVYNTVNNNSINISEDNAYESIVQYSHIDLGNSYYIIVYGYDENGNTTWTYETEKVFYEDGYSSEFMGFNDNKVYVMDNGKLICLDVNTGNIIWKKEEYNIINFRYNIFENGKICLFFGDKVTNFLAIDKNGKVLADLNLAKYEKDLENIPLENWIIDYDESIITMSGAIDTDNQREWIVQINMNNYDVKVNEIKYEKLQSKNIAEKTLYCEYGESYSFKKDGTFEYRINNNYIEKYSTLKLIGTWKIEDDRLFLDITKEIVAEGGHYEQQYDGISDEYFNVLVDYDEKSISKYREDVCEVRYYPDYNGKEMVYINGLLFEVL